MCCELSNGTFFQCSRHKLELKAITAISSVIATVAIYHQAAFMFKWYNTAGG